MGEQSVRQEWLRTLAKASLGDLETAWTQLKPEHPFEKLRATETGLAMIRGRADGTGRPFNLGEATVTRSVVTTHDSSDGSEIAGVGYLLGRDKQHAELIARLDAVFQDKGTPAIAREAVLQSIRERLDRTAAVAAQKTASTRVEFFTMLRGE